MSTNNTAVAAAANTAVAAAIPNSGMVKARAGLPEVKILAKLDAKGEDAFLPLISNMTGDKDFAQKFVACVKLQIKNAWKRVGGRWENDFNLVPVDSVLECLYKCATLKVMPDGYNGYLAVYKGKNPRCQFLADYKGLIGAAISEGIITDCNAKEVCANDDIVIDWGEVTKFRIDPKKPRGNIIGCVAYAVLPNGARRSIYMDLVELKKVKSCSMTGNVWAGWEVEMYKKTAIRRLLKTMPISSARMIGLFDADNENYDLNRAAVPEAETSSGSKMRNLAGSSASPFDTETAPETAPEAEAVEEEQIVDTEAVFA